MGDCLRCGEGNTERARFCSACGSSLDPAAGATTIRRVVSVLFCDVVSSTSLSERLDPESMRRVMAMFFDEMKAVISTHGGTVEKFIGDAVMAVFGVPRLYEDDALRAVRAAFEMRRELDRLNRSLEVEWGVRLETRTGVNTGEVVVGTSREAVLVTGDVVNVAARLQQAAPPGAILIGGGTYKLVKHAVDSAPVEPLVVKGKSEPVVAVQLEGILEGAQAFPRRLDSPMVGRTDEGRRFLQAFHRAVAERRGKLQTILGPPGIGKSRLVGEVTRDLGSEATIVMGRCLPYGRGITYWPVYELVEQAAGLTGGESPDHVRAKIASLFATEPDASLLVEHVSHIVGLSDKTFETEETFWSIRRLFEVLARHGPLVVVFDDVHWGEPTLLELIDHLVDRLIDSPVLVVAVGREEVLEERPGWGVDDERTTTIAMEPLGEGEVCDLMSNLLGSVDIPEQVNQRILDAADGNPLFVEQLVAMMIDEGLLQREGDRWAPAARLPEVAVPPTIHAVLAARLDQLSDPERRVIERASVVGRLFPKEAVTELSDEDIGAPVDPLLVALVQKDLIRIDDSAFPVAGEVFRFRHILVRDAAYGSIPKKARAGMHARYGAWLESTLGGRSREYEEIIGYHLERAFELQSELGRAADALSVGRKASLHLAKAGTRALARGDMAAATNLLHRSVALLPPNDPDRLGLLPELADALIYSGKFDRAEALLDEAIDEARAQGNERLQWHARVERTLLHRQTDPSSGGAALDEAFAAIDFFRSAQDDLGLSRAYFLVQEVHLDELLYAKAETFLHKGLAHARKAGDERGITDILAALAFAGLWGPAPVEKAIARCERILAESGDNRRVASAALRSLGGLEAMRGDFATAEELLRRGFLILDELGLTFSAAASCQVWAVLETLRGNPEAAESHLRRGFEVLSEMGEMYVRATVAGALGEALWAQGRYEEASAFVTIGEETAAADDLVSRAKWRAVRAKLLTLEGKTDHGTALAHEAVELLSNSDFLDLRGDCFADLSEVLRRAGREQESMQALEEAASFYERKGNTVSAGRVRRLAGVGASDAPS